MASPGLKSKLTVPSPTSNWFARFAKRSSETVGSSWAFTAAIVIIAGWIITGPIFHFSDAWQLIINSVTNIITFFVVFLIQNSQNRDFKAINLKLDEVIRSHGGAKNDMIDIENLTDDELRELERQYERLREEGERRRHERREDLQGKRQAKSRKAHKDAA
jgi:low affinity Fe/Cu permease